MESNRRKKLHTTHHRDIPNSVTILRERHPFEGRSLQVMSTIKRRGVQLLLLALPDGSRSLIPAIWTDWKASKLSNEPANIGSEARQRCLAPLSDLLHARLIVDGLLSRCCPIREANPADYEGRCHATDPGVSRSLPSATKAKCQDRHTSPQRGHQGAGAHHRRTIRRDNQTNGDNQ